MPSSSARELPRGVRSRGEVPFVIDNAAATDISGKNCNHYTFLLNTPVAVQAEMFAPFLLDKGKKWYFITAAYAFGQDIAKSFKELLAKAGGTVVGDDSVPLAILRVACRGRGRRSRLCRIYRRDLESLRSAHACIRRRQPPRCRGRDGRIPDRLIDPAGGAARLRLFSFSFPPSFVAGGARPRGDLSYNALSDSGVAYRLIQDCAPRSRRATLCA